MNILTKSKNKLILLLIVLVMAFTAVSCSSTSSDNYPSKAIKLIVPFGSGGGSDQFARILEQEIENQTDIDITVINIPGAKTAVGFENFMQEPADGYTITIATTDTIINMTQGLVDASISEIEAIAVPQLNVDMLFINSDEERFGSFDEMVKYSVDNNVELKIATLGVDGSEFLTISEISKVTGAKFALIPYSEPGERYAALAGKHVDVLFEQPGDVTGFLESNEYTPIIAMTDSRLEDFSDVPTSVENGINITTGYWRAVLIKSDTPDEVKELLRTAVIDAINTDAYKEYASNKYLDLITGYFSKEDANNFITSEFDNYSK